MSRDASRGRAHLCARFLTAWTALALAPLLVGATRPTGLGDVRDVRSWSHPEYTRVVVELSRPVGEVKVVRLPTPDRLYVDLDGIWVGLKYEQGIPVGDGLLKRLRLGQNTLRRSRLVVDLDRYERYRVLVLQSPHRLVIDVYAARKHQSGSRERPPGTAGAPAPERLPAGLRPVQTVVIDPGHGGRDPGATGIGGLREKDVNLRLSRMLEQRLSAAGFDVILTRSTDKSIDLEERTAIAESSRADLFISIHANASRRKGTRGIEIYYLDENHERHALDVASRENGVPRNEMDSLQTTLAKLRVEELSLHSGRLAGLVHSELLSGLSGQYGGVEDLGVKTGPFYVLFLSSIPSILVESGFVTNEHDARLLKQSAYLEDTADHITAGVIRFRDSSQRFAGTIAGTTRP